MQLAIKGKVDEWRILRNNAYLIHCSLVKDPQDMIVVLPLPYDDEIPKLVAQEQHENVFLYEQAKQAGYFQYKIA